MPDEPTPGTMTMSILPVSRVHVYNIYTLASMQTACIRFEWAKELQYCNNFCIDDHIMK